MGRGVHTLRCPYILIEVSCREILETWKSLDCYSVSNGLNSSRSPVLSPPHSTRSHENVLHGLQSAFDLVEDESWNQIFFQRVEDGF